MIKRFRDHSLWFRSSKEWWGYSTKFTKYCENINHEFEVAITDPNGMRGCIYFIDAAERDRWIESFKQSNSKWVIEKNRVFDFVLNVKFNKFINDD